MWLIFHKIGTIILMDMHFITESLAIHPLYSIVGIAASTYCQYRKSIRIKSFAMKRNVQWTFTEEMK